jgi:hypothetical protein
MHPLKATQWLQERLTSHIEAKHLTATIAGWALHTAEDGAPLVAVRVTGPDAEKAITSFAQDEMLLLADGGDQRPALEYDVPGRIACTWRTEGTWISLWTPDTPPVPQKPVQRPARGIPLAPGVRAAWSMLRRPRIAEKEKAV